MKIIDGVEVPTCIDCTRNKKHRVTNRCSVWECTFSWDANVCVNFKQKQRGKLP